MTYKTVESRFKPWVGEGWDELALIDEAWDEVPVEARTAEPRLEDAALLDDGDSEWSGWAEEAAVEPEEDRIVAFQETPAKPVTVGPGVSIVYINRYALMGGMELAHSNHVFGTNHLILSLGQGCEITFLHYFDANGAGGAVRLVIGNGRLQAADFERLRMNLAEGPRLKKAFVTELPERVGDIPRLEARLQRFVGQVRREALGDRVRAAA